MPPRTIERIRTALGKVGLRWEAVLAQSEQVILFGSYAAGIDSPSSDIDLLCVGDGPRVSSEGLHLIWIAPKTIQSHDWITSEIGGHIARYGQWLKGEKTFSGFEPASSKAIARKLWKIADRAAAIGQRWDRLPNAYRLQQTIKLRRDIQRLAILRNRQAIPPSPMLDSRWVAQTRKSKWIASMLSPDEPLVKLTVDMICKREVSSQGIATHILSNLPDQYRRLQSPR
jgi:nucleotidyltransferase-like protein